MKIEQSSNYGLLFSKIYDKLMSSSKYDSWNKLLIRLIRKYNITGKAIDLACGTGTISKMLLDLNFNVVGVDKSKFMIDIARTKLRNYSSNIRFIVDDLKTFRINEQFNLAVSFYDSLNYLLSINDLNLVFKNVYNHLANNAYFIFDMNTKEHVNISSRAPKREFLIDDYDVLLNFGGQNDIWQLDILIKSGNEQIKETHLERGYSSDEIIGIAKKNNFEVINVLSETKTYWDNKEYLSRQYYILKKFLNN